MTPHQQAARARMVASELAAIRRMKHVRLREDMTSQERNVFDNLGKVIRWIEPSGKPWPPARSTK